MVNNPTQIGSYRCGAGHPLLIIAEPCVIESMELTLRIADRLRAISSELPVQIVFKASFDKANRTSGDSFRGAAVGRLSVRTAGGDAQRAAHLTWRVSDGPPRATNSTWLTYGNSMFCDDVPCVYPNGVGAAQCPTGAVYNAQGINPDYQDCEDNSGSSSGYQDDVSGTSYDCGGKADCFTGPNNCAPGSQGTQLRCKNNGGSSLTYNQPTCAPDAASPACGDIGLFLDARLIAVARANGIGPTNLF